MRMPTRLRAHARARIGGPAAHNGPRRIDARPSASATVVRRRAEKVAHTPSNVVTDAVFHAPMFAVNTDAEMNACKPKPPAVDAVGTRSHVPARMRGQPIAHTHARAQTQHLGTCVRRARIGDSFILVAKRA
jgi:hypothetical protein